MSTFRPDDVVRYRPSAHHCQEGVAIAKDCGGSVVLVDTFWQSASHDDHVLTASEIASAELVFNMEGYDELDRYISSSEQLWNKYAATDRQVVTSQHGLQKRWFIRKGARPDWNTQIDNARQVVAGYERELEAVRSHLEWARRDLADMLAAATTGQTPNPR
ncbi:Uncharacterised protein [Mycobacteroides abscessus subsp. abscessus]|uniref:hypothetical protein n=1 Tax=Mycobacteroides abscessus TaxID=36809 RepID=UPI00092A9591|nr:hypothetical protein [Mycobacteroides abscessus]SHX96547.1 Uncharacterised protein [Mycobacteroides abscessus subsp. abscessus]SIC77534.1 Uncharacterised protein [Mycobacteroides abscessus subsp. abscessus]SKP27965.1 Uncharacterised protein [Mycobacteroides abscessus subsp. abscessus]